MDGCLRVRDPMGTSYLVVWPAEVVLRTDGRETRIVHTDGRLVARLGDTVILTGSQGGAPEQIEQIREQPLREGIPASCPAPYWVAGLLGGNFR